MNRRVIMVIAIIIMVGMLGFLIKVNVQKGLVNPQFSKIFSKSQPTPIPTPTAAPPNAPKTFQFDSSTDLQAELEKINPQILDSDFE